MKKLFLSLSFILFGIAVLSQPLMKISATKHNFGKIKEEDGRKTFDFVVTNIGNSPLVITYISASCGCAIPEWTKQPIPAGGKGKITAIYDPKGRPGPFSKTLTVYTNFNAKATVLVIKGEVIPRKGSR
jgi:hypothetical protein